jgi:oxygen-independent coproporphyrinogen-3 oxidase
MTADDLRRGAAIAHLMCNGTLPYALAPLGADALAECFAPFAADGLVVFESQRLQVTPLGCFFLRNLCGALDGYRTRDSVARRFSRAV